jgi:hypothetical protein
MMEQISPADLAKHLFENDGHFAPNPYPFASPERAEFCKAIYELYVKDSEETRIHLQINSDRAEVLCQ